jgi:YHS domain-containing protein
MNSKHATLITACLLFGLLAHAQNKVFTTSEGAIRGYDPVAYYTESKPVKGQKQFSAGWNGATWYFKSDENKKMFTENPEKYAPQYGGFCAYGVSRDYKVKTEPEAWAIHNGKLYLNYDLSIAKKWANDKEGYIKKADANWSTLKNKK